MKLFYLHFFMRINNYRFFLILITASFFAICLGKGMYEEAYNGLYLLMLISKCKIFAKAQPEPFSANIDIFSLISFKNKV